MRNKKGFTLIELVAIIIVIAIITLITVPLVSNLIKASKRKAFEASMQSLIQSARTYYAKNAGDSFNTTIFKIENGKLTGDLEVKGKLPTSAIIEITGSNKEDDTIPNGDIYIQGTDGTFCGYKNHKANLVITEDLTKCPDVDTGSNPSDQIDLRTSYSKDIPGKTVDLYAKCVYSKGIKEVKFSKDGSTWYKSNRYVNNQYYYQFTGLTQNQYYNMQVECTSKDGLKEKETVKVILSNIANPEFEEGNPGWARYKQIIVKYPKESNDLPFAYQYMIGLNNFSNIETKSCNGTDCSNENTVSNKYEIETYTGDKCNTSTQVCYKFTFYDEYFNDKPLIARVDPGEDSNGDQIDPAVGSLVISKIDRTSPTWNSMANPYRNTWINTSFSITLKSNDNTGGSGIYYYMYTYADASTIDKANALGISQVGQNGYGSSDSLTKWVRYASTYDVSNTPTPQLSHTFTTTPFSAERNSDVYFRVCDHAGNCSNIARDTIKIDTTAPTCGTWSGESTTWKQGSRILYLTCSDSASGCEAGKYGQIYSNSTGEAKTATIKFTLSDVAGNSTNCQKNANVYIDNKEPTLSVAGYKYEKGAFDHPTAPSSSGMKSFTLSTSESPGWISGGINALVYATATDGGSGSGSNASNIKYDYNVHDIQSSFSRESDERYRNFTKDRKSVIKFRACDPVGNCTDYTNSYRIYVDNTAPDLTYNRSKKCSSCTVNQVKCSDNLSGTSKYKIEYYRSDKTSNGWRKTSDYWNETTNNGYWYNWSSNLGFNLKLRCTDNAGNVDTSGNIKITNKTCTSNDESDDTETVTVVDSNKSSNVASTITATCNASSVPSASATIPQLNVVGTGYGIPYESKSGTTYSFTAVKSTTVQLNIYNPTADTYKMTRAYAQNMPASSLTNAFEVDKKYTNPIETIKNLKQLTYYYIKPCNCKGCSNDYVTIGITGELIDKPTLERVTGQYSGYLGWKVTNKPSNISGKYIYKIKVCDVKAEDFNNNTNIKNNMDCDSPYYTNTTFYGSKSGDRRVWARICAVNANNNEEIICSDPSYVNSYKN